MKKLDLDNIQVGVKQRLPKSSLSHIQSSYQECFTAMLLAFNIDPLVITQMTQVVVPPVNQGDDYELVAGWVAYGGELFQVDAKSGSIVNSAVWVIEETFAGDPVIFSDANQYNVNVIRKITVVDGAPGSGLADFNQAEPRFVDRLSALLS